MKATPDPEPAGKVAGLEYLVPKPADQGYALMKGVPSIATAIASPSGVKETLREVSAGKDAGLEYLVPKPADQGYALK